MPAVEGGPARDNSLAVAPNLKLYYAAKSGTRRWLGDFTIAGKRRAPGFGGYPGVTLAQALAAAAHFREQQRAGHDPIEQRKRNERAAEEAKQLDAATAKRNAATLRKHARAYHKSIAADFKNAKHRAQWLASIENADELAPLLDRPIGSIGTDELLTALKDMRARVPETGRKVRQRLDAVFSDAVLHKLADSNPAALLVRALRPKGNWRMRFVTALAHFAHYRISIRHSRAEAALRVRYRSPLRKPWVKAGYRAELHEIGYAPWNKLTRAMSVIIAAIASRSVSHARRSRPA